MDGSRMSKDELRARQRNLTWPGFVSNARRVDEVLFKGSSNAPIVHRVGAWLFGIALVSLGLGLLTMSRSSIQVIAATFGIVLGCYVFWNGCRSSGKPQDTRKRSTDLEPGLPHANSSDRGAAEVGRRERDKESGERSREGK